MMRRPCRRPSQQRLLLTTRVQVTKTQPTRRPSPLSALIRHDDSSDDDDDDDDTSLVDGLIRYTQDLMKESNALHHVVAYSGGVDSSLVAALLQHAIRNDHDSSRQSTAVQAILGLSPAVSQEQVQLARQVASHLQVPFQEVTTTEGTNPMYIENNGQACFACKTHLYESLHAVYKHATSHRQEEESSAAVAVQLYNGTNANDLQDATRVGLIAARHFNVLSPLQHTTKDHVRRAARHLGLPNWNAAAAPCLRSRLALGVKATQVHLQMIERAECFVKRTLLQDMVRSAASNVRVRMLTNQRAMIEVDQELLEQLRLGKAEEEYFQSLGFSSVSARQFQTGSVARREPRRVETEDAVVDASTEMAAAVG